MVTDLETYNPNALWMKWSSAQALPLAFKRVMIYRFLKFSCRVQDVTWYSWLEWCQRDHSPSPVGHCTHIANSTSCHSLFSEVHFAVCSPYVLQKVGLWVSVNISVPHLQSAFASPQTLFTLKWAGHPWCSNPSLCRLPYVLYTLTDRFYQILNRKAEQDIYACTTKVYHVEQRINEWTHRLAN